MNALTSSRSNRFQRGPLMLAVAIMLPLVVVADHRGWLAVRHVDDMAAYHGRKAAVVRVIDGDTIEIDLPDALHARSATRMALWGVNAPELARGGRDAEPLAADAAALARSLCEGARVIVWLESHRTRDPLGRVLAHVELPDATRLNERLLSAGLAKVDERWPHTMLTRYAQLEFAARRQSIGLWQRNPQRVASQMNAEQ